MISNGEYRGFLCLLVVVFVFVLGFFLFLLVGVATLFNAIIDDDGSLWRLLELHGMARNFDFLVLPSIQEGGWGLC